MGKSDYRDELFEKATAAKEKLGGTWEDVTENFLRKKCEKAAKLGFYKAIFNECDAYEITFSDVKAFAKKHGMKAGHVGLWGAGFYISFAKKKKLE